MSAQKEAPVLRGGYACSPVRGHTLESSTNEWSLLGKKYPAFGGIVYDSSAFRFLGFFRFRTIFVGIKFSDPRANDGVLQVDINHFDFFTILRGRNTPKQIFLKAFSRIE